MAVGGLIPDDPWPSAFPLTVRWTCDLEATKPAWVPPPAPVPDAWTPTPMTSPAPGPPAVVPVEVRLVTSGASATLQLTGVTVADVDPPVVEGAATAAFDGGVFRVAQPEGAVRQGRVVSATFQLRTRGAASGSSIGLTVGSSSGQVGVAVYNLIGAEPVPVFAALSTPDSSGWPFTIDAAWLVEPVQALPGP